MFLSFDISKQLILSWENWVKSCLLKNRRLNEQTVTVAPFPETETKKLKTTLTIMRGKCFWMLSVRAQRIATNELGCKRERNRWRYVNGKYTNMRKWNMSEIKHDWDRLHETDRLSLFKIPYVYFCPLSLYTLHSRRCDYSGTNSLSSQKCTH